MFSRSDWRGYSVRPSIRAAAARPCARAAGRAAQGLPLNGPTCSFAFAAVSQYRVLRRDSRSVRWLPRSRRLRRQSAGCGSRTQAARRVRCHGVTGTMPPCGSEPGSNATLRCAGHGNTARAAISAVITSFPRSASTPTARSAPARGSPAAIRPKYRRVSARKPCGRREVGG